MRPTITIDTPCLFITAVAKDRLPIFRTDAIKLITCTAIDEARTSAGFMLFAYVLMPDHIHVLTDSPHKPSKVLQFIKGIVGHRVIGHLKEQSYESSFRKLQHHLNPVRADLIEKPIDYRWSSARFWGRCPTEDEPLRVDVDRIAGAGHRPAKKELLTVRQVKDLPRIRGQSPNE